METTGPVLTALVDTASGTDRLGGQPLLEAIGELAQTFPRLGHLWVESASHGSFVDWVQQTRGGTGTGTVVRRPSRWRWLPADQEPPVVPAGFQVLPRRWVVERTFGWLGRWRRTSKDDEYLPQTSECVISRAMTRIMLRRLAES